MDEDTQIPEELLRVIDVEKIAAKGKGGPEGRLVMVPDQYGDPIAWFKHLHHAQFFARAWASGEANQEQPGRGSAE